MSHIVECKLKIKDLDALEAAGQRCGLELHRGQKSYKWYGVSVGDSPLPDGTTIADLGHCDHALSVPGNSHAYEIGVCQKEDGTFVLRYDSWSGGYGLMEKVGGDDLKKLNSEYMAATIERQLQDQGWYVERQLNGDLLLNVPGGGTVTVTPAGVIDANGFVGPACQTAVDAVAAALGGDVTSRYCKPAQNMIAQANTIVAG